MKTKLFTHTDLDGVGCAIIALASLGEVDIEYCEYNNINNKVKEYIESRQCNDYSITYITDLSVNEEVAEMIEGCEAQFKLLDHHATAMWLNKYEWATVKIDDEDLGEKTCGTYMLWDELGNVNGSLFADLVRNYDTWLWKEKRMMLAKQMNDLMYILGREKFITKVLGILSDSVYFFDELFDETSLLLLELKQAEIDAYVAQKNKTIIIGEIEGYTTGIIFAERFTSEVGNRLCEMNPDLDLMVLINLDYSVSYRTIKDNVNLSEVAKVFGGGGHPKASGSPIGEGVKARVIDLVFGGGE